MQRHFKPYKGHLAVQGLQTMLDNNVPLEAIFTLTAHLPFPSLYAAKLPKWVPAQWNTHLADFYNTAEVGPWLVEQKTAWDEAVEQSQRVFKDANFRAFLADFMGDISETFTFMPNISYPTTTEIGLRVGKNQLIVICPPRLAWGDSPPWPFDEDKHYLHRVTLGQYLRLILVPYLRTHAAVAGEAAKNDLPVGDKFRAQYPTWGAQFVNIFMMAAIAIYLERIDEREARAYIQNKVKIDGVKILPGAVSVLQRYLQERESGKFNELVDFLPVFPKQLKVAKRIMSI